jgi:hypothetical protein
MSYNHLQSFWKLLSLKKIPENKDEINAIVQSEMMKHHTYAHICKIMPNQVEKHITKLFVQETNYYCSQSKLLIKDETIRKVIDMLKSSELKWYIGKTRENTFYLIASWNHWNHY